MARPLKKGLDYWRFDVDLLDDKKFKLIRGEFGAKGVLIALFALNSCYKENGYFKVWDDDDAILMAESIGCGVSPELVQQVIRACVARSLFDRRVFDVHHVLTSVGIQRRYIQIVAKNRFNIPLIEDYWLIPKNEIAADSLSKCSFQKVAHTENPDMRTEKGVFRTENPSNTIQYNNTLSLPTREEALQTFGRFANVELTPEEYDTLKKEIPDADELIERFSAKLESKGYTFQNHFATLLSWHQDEMKKEKERGQARATPKQTQGNHGSFDVDDFFQAALERTYQNT